MKGLLIGIISQAKKSINEYQQKANALNESLKLNDKKRVIFSLVIICIGFCSILIINNVLPNINTDTWRYESPVIIPVINPVGGDFRLGLYWPAENLIKSGSRSVGTDGTYQSIYPPLVHVISLPYLLFKIQTAYIVHVVLLFLANIFSLLLASLMVKEFILSRLKLDKMFVMMITIFIFFGMAIYTFISYPFAFSIERGNYDAFPIFFSILAMWVILKRPEKLWLQVILLSVAVHLKIYPAVLFIILLFKHGIKLVLPALVINLAFLFILGPMIGIDYIQFVASSEGAGIGNNFSWIGNHAAYSFSKLITIRYPSLSSSFFVLWGISMFIPIILWSFSAISLFKNGYSSQNMIFLIMVTIPLMDLLPTASNDYKLIILYPAVILLFSLIMMQIIKDHHWLNYAQFGILFLILLFLGRPYAMSSDYVYALKPTSSIFINNKYLWSLALEIVMVWNIYKNFNTEIS